MSDTTQAIAQALQVGTPGDYTSGLARVHTESYQGKVFNHTSREFEPTGLTQVQVFYDGKRSSESLLADFSTWGSYRKFSVEESHAYLLKLFDEITK